MTIMSEPIIVETVCSDSEDEYEVVRPTTSKEEFTSWPPPQPESEAPPPETPSKEKAEDTFSSTQKKEKTSTSSTPAPPTFSPVKKRAPVKKKEPTPPPPIEVETAHTVSDGEESLGEEDVFKVGGKSSTDKYSSSEANLDYNNYKSDFHNSMPALSKKTPRKHRPGTRTATADPSPSYSNSRKVPLKGSKASAEKSAPPKKHSPSAHKTSSSSNSRPKHFPRNKSSDELDASIHLSVRELQDKLAKLEAKLVEAKQNSNYELAADLEHGGIPDLKALLKEKSWNHKVLQKTSDTPATTASSTKPAKESVPSTPTTSSRKESSTKSSQQKQQQASSSSTKATNDKPQENFNMEDADDIKAKLAKLEAKLAEAERTGKFELASDLKFGAIPELKSLLKKQESSGNVKGGGDSASGATLKPEGSAKKFPRKRTSTGGSAPRKAKSNLGTPPPKRSPNHKEFGASSPRQQQHTSSSSPEKEELEKRLRTLKAKLAKAEKDGEMDRVSDLKYVAIPDLEEKLQKVSSSGEEKKSGGAPRRPKDRLKKGASADSDENHNNNTSEKGSSGDRGRRPKEKVKKASSGDGEENTPAPAERGLQRSSSVGRRPKHERSNSLRRKKNPRPGLSSPTSDDKDEEQQQQQHADASSSKPQPQEKPSRSGDRTPARRGVGRSRTGDLANLRRGRKTAEERNGEVSGEAAAATPANDKRRSSSTVRPKRGKSLRNITPD